MFYKGFIACLLVIWLTGCSQISYYGQSVSGHSRLMLKRQPVKRVLKGTELNQDLRAQLQLSQKVLAFAHQELGLPKTKSYRAYVDLGRDFPVWNVVAAQEFSLHAQQWCYLVIGCASYRGYFSKERAERYAQTLQQKGMETYVGGAVAYSTLGWFRDPLLSSMFRYGDHYLIETLIHELAHQKLYWNGWSELNEGFATVVADAGMERWLQQNAPQDLAQYQARKRAEADFDNLIAELKKELQNIYNSGQMLQKKRVAKQSKLVKFYDNYRHLRVSKWGGKGWFDQWLMQPVNNARLAAYSTYQSLIPQLKSLLSECGQDFQRFYDTLAELKLKDFNKPELRHLPTECD